MGKFVCGLCALCGVFIITLPIPIVVSSFAMCYKVRPGYNDSDMCSDQRKLWRNEIATRKRMACRCGSDNG